MKFFLLILFSFLFVFPQRKERSSLSNKEILKALDDLRNHRIRQIDFLAKTHGIQFDRTAYTQTKKERIVKNYFLNGEYEKLSKLYFFKTDTNLSKPTIKQWIAGVYLAQDYEILLAMFQEFYPNNFHVISVLYKLKRYSSFLINLERSSIKRVQFDYMKLDALFKLKAYHQIVNDEKLVDEGHHFYKDILKIFLRAHYKEKNYKQVTELFGKLDNDHSQELLFLAAKSHLFIKNYKIADFMLRKFIEQFYDQEMRELQLATYYQGLSWQEQGNEVRAKQFYKKAIAYNPDYSSLKAFTHQSLASFYEARKEYGLASKEWKFYLAYLPERREKKRKEIKERIEILDEKAFLHSKKR